MKSIIDEALESRFRPALLSGDLTLIQEYIEVFAHDLSRFHTNDHHPDSRKNTFRPPLFEAVLGGHANIIQALAGIPDINFNLSYQGSSLLHAAAMLGNADMISLLLKSRCNAVDNRDNYGNTPLIVAARRNHPTVVKVLLEEGHANASLKNRKGKSALDYVMASERLVMPKPEYLETANLLIEARSLTKVQTSFFHYVPKENFNNNAKRAFIKSTIK